MSETAEERRARILAAMAASINPPAQDTYPNGVRRQPWDERLPSGESAMEIGLPKGVRDMLNQQTVQGQQSQKPIVNVPKVNPALPTSSLPNVDRTPADNLGPVGEPRFPAGAPPVRIGYGTAGLTGVDKLMEQRKAYESADPESRVNVTPDFTEIDPPHGRKGFKGKLKSIGEGLLIGLASGDPNNPNNILGSMIGGGALGGASNRGEAKLKRRFEMNQLDNDIERGLKLEQQGGIGRGRGPLGNMSTRVVGEGEYEGVDAGTEIRVRVNPRTGEVIDIVGPDKKPVISKSPKAASGGAPHYDKDDEGYLISVQGGVAQRVTDKSGNPVKVRGEGPRSKVTIDGREFDVTDAQALNYYGQIGKTEDKKTEQQSKRTAKINESSALYRKADNNEENAKKLEESLNYKDDKGQPMLDANGEQKLFDLQGHEITDGYEKQQEQERRRKQIDALRNEARELRAKGDAARAEGESIPESSSTSQKTLDPELEKKIRAAATAKGLNPDIAVQRAIARQ
jgi:hypothetical protein